MEFQLTVILVDLLIILLISKVSFYYSFNVIIVLGRAWKQAKKGKKAT